MVVYAVVGLGLLYFYLMAIQKLFTDESGGELVTFFNQQHKCYICVGQEVLNKDIVEFKGHIVLDADDLTELINELQYIRQRINNETL